MKNLDKSFTYQYLHPWLGTGLLTSTGRMLSSVTIFQSMEQLEVYSLN
jgi:hypothetical protein